MNKQASTFTIDTIFSYYQKYNNQIFVGILVMASLIVGGYYYRAHRSSQEEAAQTAFSICMQERDRAFQGQTTWPEVELASRAGYQQHSSAAIAPYFLAIQAESLINQHKKAEGIAVLDELLRAISATSPLYSVYATKRALARLDVPDMQAAGLKELEELANNKANLQRDEALYQLVQYYQHNNNEERAELFRKELLTSYQQSGPAASPFAERIASRQD